MAFVDQCKNGRLDFGEIDIDCGGTCGLCRDGKRCDWSRDCASRSCVAGVCVMSSCFDHAWTGDETDVDCGGSCPPCMAKQWCKKDADCATGICSASSCQPASCGDRFLNGSETSLDCGGPDCRPCDDRMFCAAHTDCRSGWCRAMTCVSPFEVGGGSTNENPRALAVLDIDHDGKRDLLVGGHVRNGNMFGNLDRLIASDKLPGWMRFQTYYAAGGHGATAIAAADLDADGKTDAVLANENSTLTVLISAGDDVFHGTEFKPPADIALPGITPSSLAIADMDGDGRLDLIVTSSVPAGGAGLFVLPGDGKGAFGGAIGTPAGRAPSSVTIADFDADKKLDAAVANHDGADVLIFWGRGDGRFDAPTAIAVHAGPSAIAAGDIAGDGWPGLAVADEGSDDVAIIRNLAFRTFAIPLYQPAGRAPIGVGLADFDGDGRIDLAVASREDAVIRTRRGVGKAFFALPEIVTSIWSSPISLSIADVDKDGHPDIALVTRHAPGAFVLYSRFGP